MILHHLICNGIQRFGQIKSGVEGISQKVLADTLKRLEEDGIILREVFAEVPPRVEYSLSQIGKSLSPIMEAMSTWGNCYKNTQC